MEHGHSLSDELLRETATLRRIARGIVLEPGLAEDAVQEAWLAALQRGAGAAPGGGWLTEAVRRIAYGLRRREARQARREVAAAKREETPSAADTAARLELMRELLNALRELDEPYRTAVQLRLIDDLPPREIAARTGVPVETARTRVRRGVERIRAQLDAKHSSERGEFLALLAPLAGFDPLRGAVAAALTHKTVGGALMGVQTKVGVVAALAVAAGLVLWSPWSNSNDGPTRVDSAAAPFARTQLDQEASTSEPSTAPAAEVGMRDAVSARDEETALAAQWILRGKVVSKSGALLSGVDVRIALVDGYDGGDDGQAQVARSDEDGVFALSLEKPHGPVRVRTSVTGGGHFARMSERLVLRDAPAPQNLVVTCYPLDIALRGRVIDVEQRPIAAASVLVLGDPVTTNDEGRFEALASSELGNVRVTAWREGFAQNHATVQLDRVAKTVEDIELVLGPGGVLRGRVVDGSGRRVEGAEIVAFPGTRAKTTSDTHGNFELRELPLGLDWLSVGVTASGYARKRLSFQQGQLPAEPLEIVLEGGVTIAGVVRDAEGAPLPGAKIGFGSSQFDVDVRTGVAGDGGVFELRDCPRTNANLWVEASGYATHVEALDLREQRGVAEFVILLERGVTLHGTVVDSDGAPLNGVRVSLRTPDDYLNNETTTAADGRFELRNAPERSDLQVECFGAGLLRTTVDVADGAKDLRIEMARAAGICGRVVDARSGEPIPRFRVRFVATNLSHGLLSGVSVGWLDSGVEFVDDDGRWSTAGQNLTPGEATGVEITAAGYAPAIAERVVATVDPSAAPIVLALSAPAKLEGVVLDASTGAPVAKAVVRCVPRSGGQALEATLDPKRTYSTKEGAFVLEDLSPDSAWLIVEAPGYAPLAAGPFDPSAAGTRCVLELARGATLRGVLRGADGRPESSATVMVSVFESRTGDSRSWRLETDTDGRFAVSDLAPGSYQVARMLQRGPFGVVDLSTQIEIDDVRDYEVELRPRGATRLVGSVVAVGAGFDGTFRAERLDEQDAPTNETRAGFVVDGQFELEGLSPGRWRVEVNEYGRYDLVRSGSTAIEIEDEAVLTVQVEARTP